MNVASAGGLSAAYTAQVAKPSAPPTPPPPPAPAPAASNDGDGDTDKGGIDIRV